METGQRPRPSLDDLDAVTLDAYGTLVRLRDRIRSLRKAHRLEAGMWFEPAPIGDAIARWT